MKTLQLTTITTAVFFVVFAVIWLNFPEQEKQPDDLDFTDSSLKNANYSSSVSDGGQENRNPLELQRVLDSCNSTGIQPSIGYRYSNDTHIITNISCQWQALEEFENGK